MKHYLLKAVNRDVHGKITGYGEPFTVPPGLGVRLLRKYPQSLELEDHEYEVDDDPRLPGSHGKKWEEGRVKNVSTPNVSPPPRRTTKDS